MIPTQLIMGTSPAIRFIFPPYGRIGMLPYSSLPPDSGSLPTCHKLFAWQPFANPGASGRIKIDSPQNPPMSHEHNAPLGEELNNRGSFNRRNNTLVIPPPPSSTSSYSPPRQKPNPRPCAPFWGNRRVFIKDGPVGGVDVF